MEKFQNENVSVEAEVKPGCSVKLDVTVMPACARQCRQEAVSRVRKEVSLPGFRKGKAPDSLILTHYAKAVDQEEKEVTLNSAFQEALKLVPYQPLRADAKSIKSALKEALKFSFEYEFIPTPPSIAPEALLKEAVPLKEVEQADVEEKVGQIQLMFATWEEVTGRPAEPGDFVRLDVDEIKEGVPVPDFQNQRFELKDKKMSPWMQKLVIGLEVGAAKEGMSAPGEALDFTDEEMRASFKPALFRITLKAIEKPTLPALDDTLAQKVGAKTVEEMKSSLQKQLERQAMGEKREKERLKLEEQLYKNYTFELPKSLIEKTKNEKQLALYYLMRKFNQENGVTVTKEDLHNELALLLQQFPKEMLPQITQSINEDVYAAILSEVVVRKGIDKLLEKIA